MRAPGRRIVSLVLPRTRRGRVLALGAAMDALASGMFLAAATLYFVGIVGLSVTSVGVALSVASLCGLASPLPLGWLADRVGALPVYLVLLIVRAVGYVAYVFVEGFTGYLVLTCLLTAAGRACTPLLQVIVGEFEGQQDRTKTMASLRSVNNIGLTLGFLLAGLVQLAGSRAAFAGMFVFIGLAFVGVAVCTIRAARLPAPPSSTPSWPGSAPHSSADASADASAGSSMDSPAGSPVGPPADSAPPAQRPAPPAEPDGRSPYRDGRFVVFTLANAFLMLHDSILFIFVPLWVVERSGLPATVSSVLLAINTVLTVVVQVRLSRLDHGVARSRRLLRRACLALVASCAVFAAADQRAAAVVVVGATLAVVLLTVGENLHAVAGWELSYQMSTAPARTQYLSLFSLGTTAQMIVGPVLVTAVILPRGTIGWILLAVGFSVATAIALGAVRSLDAPRTTLRRPAQPRTAEVP